MTLVVDASVVVKWFFEEAGSYQARELLAVNDLLLAPAHAAAEIGHVLARRVRDGHLTRETMGTALAGLSRAVVLLPLADLYAEATAVAVETGTSFYDALYVAAATNWTATLVTADERLMRGLAHSPWSNRLVALQTWRPTGRFEP